MQVLLKYLHGKSLSHGVLKFRLQNSIFLDFSRFWSSVATIVYIWYRRLAGRLSRMNKSLEH